MLISWRPPIAVTASSNLSFQTDPASLTSGRTADATNIKWLVSASPATTQNEKLIGACSATRPRCAALLMPKTAAAIPDGVLVKIRAYDVSNAEVTLGGNALTQRTQVRADGSVCVCWVFPKISTDCVRFEVSIYNDRNGATWLVLNQLFDAGELWFGDGADFRIVGTPEEDFVSLTQRRATNDSPQPLLQHGYRTFNVSLVPMTQAQAIGPNPAQLDFQSVRDKISRTNAAVIIPAYLKPSANPGSIATVDSTTIDTQQLHRSFMLGNPESGIKMSGYGQKRFSVASFVWGESPP